VSSRSQRTDDPVNETVELSRGLGLVATHDAQEALGRSSRATLDTLTTFSGVSQQVNRELTDFMMSGTREVLKLVADMQGNWLEATQKALGGFTTNGPAVEAWQTMLDGNTKAFGQYAEIIQGAAEKGTDRIKEAVEVMADQVKESTGQLASIADVIEDDKPAAGRTSRAS
jgi:hypothetical protein